MKPDEYMGKACRALASAKLLLESGDCEGACNRAYYAMFDAAHAALLIASPTVNVAVTKTHRGLIAAFGEHLVKTELLSIELGRSLNQIERIRLLEDYTDEEIAVEDTRKAIEQAETFVLTIQNRFQISKY